MRTLKKILFPLAFNMGALYVVTQLIEGVTYTGGWVFFAVAGLTIGLLNVLVKPFLKFLSIPLILFSGGLFLIVINAAILWLTDQLLEIFDFTNIDFQIEGVVSLVLAALVFGLVNWFEHWIFKRVR